MSFEMKQAKPLARPIDISEKGKDAEGNPISMDRRLYMQLLAFGGCVGVAPLCAALERAGLSGVLYEDVNDPYGIGLLTFSEYPDYFLTDVRRALQGKPFAGLRQKPEHTLLGRTYSIGYEQDLLQTLIERPMRRVLDPTMPWAIWYPLRRSGQFEHLSEAEQNEILREHGGIGRAYGSSGLAYDVRLACHGLDVHDNDFIAGLVGKDLHPLSHIVQRMRKTQQTSLYLQQLGPFFVGKAVWQSALPEVARD